MEIRKGNFQKKSLSEAAAGDIATARRLADYEFKKLRTLNKDITTARIGSLKVSLKFLKNRRTEEENDIEKKRYDQKITEIQAQLARMQGTTKPIAKMRGERRPK